MISPANDTQSILISDEHDFDTQARHLLNDALASSRQCALLAVDLADVRLMNDCFDAAAEGRVSELVGREFRLRASGPFLLGWRHSGELVVLLADDATPETAGTFAQNLVEALANAGTRSDGSVGGVASIGIAFCPHNATDLPSLTHAALTALRASRRPLLPPLVAYQPGIARYIAQRRWLGQLLAGADGVGELHLDFHPLMSLADEAVVSVEASARWIDPEHGDITSAELAAIAEDSGLQLELGERVMQAALAAHAEWKRHVANPPPVTVGITSGQLAQLESVERYAELIRRHGARPTDLELNFRESGASHSERLVLVNLLDLRNMGMKIALDDVGAGTSSFSHLRDLPISGLKIDRSFVAESMRDARTLTIVNAIIGTARALGIDTAAKGIDSEARRTWMGHLGCTRDKVRYLVP